MKELDSTTIRAAARRDSEAFAKLYQHYNRFVWKVVFRTVNGDFESAKEILQDVFVKAYYSFKSYRFDSALSTWLYRIAYTTTLNHLRGKNGWLRRFVSLDENRTAARGQTTLENRDMVERVLSSLKPHERFLLVAREVDGVTFDDLARITSLSPGALRTRLSRLKDTVRKEFGHEV